MANGACALSEAQLESIVRIASESAIDKYKKEAEADRQQRKKQVVNNVKVLLKNYRSFKDMTIHGVYDRETSVDESLVELLDLMHSDRHGDVEVESIKNRVAKTALMLEHIDDMLAVYKKRCDRTAEGRRRYRILSMMYLDDSEPVTAAEIAEMENVVERTVFRDIKIVYDELSVLFFGIDGIRLKMA